MSACCCNSGPPGPPFCPPKFRLKDCQGNPIVGASVVFSCPPVLPGGYTCTLPSPATGVTDALGEFTGPSMTEPASNYMLWRVYHGGVSYGGSFLGGPHAPTTGAYMTRRNCDGRVYEICYYQAKATIAVSDAADVHIGTDLAGTLPGATVTGEGTASIVVEYEQMFACSATSPLPRDYAFELVPSTPGYRSACVSFTLDCFDDIAVTTSWHDSSDCYYDAYSGPDGLFHPWLVPCAPDLGCTYGPGPNYRGWISKQFEVMFESLDGRNDFGDDEGAWIALPSVATYSGGTFAGYAWKLCRESGRGNFLSYGRDVYHNPTCDLNVPAEGETTRLGFASISIELTCNSLIYTRWPLAGCTVAPCVPGTGYIPIRDADGNLCQAISSGVGGISGLPNPSNPFAISGLGAPLSLTLGGYTGAYCTSRYSEFVVHVREKC